MSEAEHIEQTTQGWFRDYSRSLANSYEALGRIAHNPTKGEAREDQVLDILKNLPKSGELVRNPVILDSNGKQTAKFDGAILDRWTWPLIFTQNPSSASGVTAAPLESVFVAFEIKSALDRGEIDDIFTKAKSIRALSRGLTLAPKTAAFAYCCTNPNLSFLDYAVSVRNNGFDSPNLMCILGSAVMGIAREQDGKILFTDDWQKDSFPGFVRCGDDALLLFFYLLSLWVSANPGIPTGFERYVKGTFSNLNVFHFDQTFLDSIVDNPTSLDGIRETFKRRGTTEIEQLYNEVRSR